MKLRRRIALIRRQVKRFVAIAAERAARAQSPCAKPSSFAEAAVEAIVGVELLGAIGGARRRA